jgi:hypothetical protein
MLDGLLGKGLKLFPQDPDRRLAEVATPPKRA